MGSPVRHDLHLDRRQRRHPDQERHHPHADHPRRHGRRLRYNLVATLDSARKSRATSIVYPTGEQISLAWASATYCSDNRTAARAASGGSAVRLQSASSSLGYQLHLNYGLAEATSLAEYNAWKQLNSINAINTTVEACNPSAHSCTLTEAWPTVSIPSGSNVTDPAGRTTGYTATANNVRNPPPVEHTAKYRL